LGFEPCIKGATSLFKAWMESTSKIKKLDVQIKNLFFNLEKYFGSLTKLVSVIMATSVSKADFYLVTLAD
jgi:hypothetical protein